MNCPRCNGLVVPDIPAPLPRRFCLTCGWDTYPEPILKYSNAGTFVKERNGNVDVSALGPLPDAFQVSDLVDRLRSTERGVTYAEVVTAVERLGYQVARRQVIQVQERDGPLWASFHPLPPLIVDPGGLMPPSEQVPL